MKNYIRAVLCSLFISAVSSVNGAVTVNISSSGWADESGTPMNGMAWGLVFATNGSSFGGSFDTDLSSGIVGFTPAPISDPATATQIFGDYYFARAQSDTTSSGPPTFSDGFMFTTRFNLDANVSTGDSYGLLWLPSGSGSVAPSDYYGFQDLAQSVPSDGSTTAVISGSPTSASFQAVPEPSSFGFLLGCFGLGFVFLRRRV